MVLKYSEWVSDDSINAMQGFPHSEILKSTTYKTPYRRINEIGCLSPLQNQTLVSKEKKNIPEYIKIENMED